MAPMNEEVRILTVKQPWAALLVLGVKTIELRSRPTKYRGHVLILAGQSYSEVGAEWGLDDPSVDTLAARGAIVGAVRLVGCEPTTEEHRDASCVPSSVPLAGLFSWRVERAIHLDSPIPQRGALGLVRMRPEQFSKSQLATLAKTL